MIYAIYNNKVYIANVRNMKVRLKTRIPEQGFKELVDLAGNIHKDIFIKEVEMDEVAVIYELQYKVIYKGKEFEVFSSEKYMLEYNQVILYTKEFNIAEKYGFKKKEQFVYDKDVQLNDIEALIKIKRPILKFNNIQEEKTRIEQKVIKNYLKNIIE